MLDFPFDLKGFGPFQNSRMPMTRSPGRPKDDKPQENATPTLGPVKVQKRVDRPAPDGSREKACSECQRLFTLQPGDKYYLCPDCYRKTLTPKRSIKGARILTHIKCASCGTEEYVTFVPTDRTTALCGACHLKQKREQKMESRHPSKA